MKGISVLTGCVLENSGTEALFLNLVHETSEEPLNVIV